MLPIIFVVWFGISLLLMAVPEKIYKMSIAFFMAITLLFWLQGNVLVWNYGVLDGRQIAWGRMWLFGLIDIIIWITVIVAAILFRKTLVKHALKFSVVILLIQSAALFGEIQHAPEPVSAHEYHLDESYRFSFSEDKNIILLILDAFQTDIMQELLVTHPEYNEILDGFTFYRNATSAYSKTYATIPLLLTGEWYENHIPIQQFMEQSFAASSITNNMMKAGWRVDLFPWVHRTICFSESIASNITCQIDPRERLNEAGKLIDLSLFRSVPHFIKPIILNDYKWQFTRNLELIYGFRGCPSKELAEDRHFHRAIDFIQNLALQARTCQTKPAFKMYHLPVPHEPFLLNGDLQLDRLSSTREGFVRHSVAGLEVTRRLIEKLKRLDIYDNTMLVVVSDHGGGDYNASINYSVLPDHLGKPEKNWENIPHRYLQSALPLILIKPFEKTGELTISDLPVSLADIPFTIESAAGFEPKTEGYNILQMDGTENAVRRYLFYDFKGWDRLYLPVMEEYVVSGHSWLPQNWEATGNIFAPPEGTYIPVSALEKEYKRGDRLCFKGEALSRGSMVRGWSRPERYGTWSQAHKAALNIPLKEPLDSCVQVSFFFRGFTVEGSFDTQNVELLIDQEVLAQWEVCSEYNWYKVTVPDSLVRDRYTLMFTFNLPDATSSPFDHHLSIDTRNLGICLSAVVIR
ncbi:hypothetical protein CHISP_3442 [Chitinispirillum alkaliphilum]|nr:hypothetical protein CHISP_3442 [Chitinispirillum alkaliphilum]